MTPPTLVSVAKALADVLRGGQFAQPVTTAFAFLPVYDPEQLKVATITVVPKGREAEIASRSGLDEHFHVDLGVQKKLTYEPDEVEKLLALVDQIETFVRGQALEGFGDLAWVGSANVPLYAPEHLRKGVFTSVLTVTYRAVGGGI